MTDEHHDIKAAVDVELPAMELKGTATTSLIVTTTTGPPLDQIERDYTFSPNIPSGEIVKRTTEEAGIQLEPVKKEGLRKTIDIVKTYWSEVSLKLNLQEGFELKIRREPKEMEETVTKFKKP